MDSSEDHERWCRLDFGGTQTVSVRNLSACDARCALGFTGAQVSTCSELLPPSIYIHPGYLLGEAAEAVNVLAPGEEVQCHRRGNMDIYAHDGMTRLRRGATETIAYLPDPSAPKLRGAFGIALSRALAQTGGIVLHAAAMAWRGHTCLLIGASGSGKSTLAISTLSDNGAVLSDDLILVCPPNDGQGQFKLHPMRRDVYLRLDSSGIITPELGHLVKPASTASGPKLRIRRESAGSLFTHTAEPTCVLLLTTRTQRQPHSRVEEISQATVLAAIIGANPFLAPGSSYQEPTAMSTAITLAAALPALRLSVGSDLLMDSKRELLYIEERLGLALGLRAGEQAIGSASGTSEKSRRQPKSYLNNCF